LAKNAHDHENEGRSQKKHKDGTPNKKIKVLRKYTYMVTKNIDLTNLALVEHKDMTFVKVTMP
jgi:hypothetical protein